LNCRRGMSLSRVNFKAHERRLPVRMSPAGVEFVLFDWEAAGHVGSEGHLGNLTGDDLSLDVIAVQMQGDGPITAPAQLDSVPLLDLDQPRVRRDGTLLYL